MKSRIEETFVINLKQCKNRMRRFDEHMTSIGLPYTRWDAVHGKSMSSREIERVSSKACANFACTHGVIGCYLSHVMLWQHILKKYGNEDRGMRDDGGCMEEEKDGRKIWFIVFEDDIMTKPGFLDNIQTLFERDLDLTNPAWMQHRYPEMIHLWCTVMCSADPVTANLFRAHVITGTAAYMVSLDGVRKLLKYMGNHVSYHIDVMISLHQILRQRLALYTTSNLIINDDIDVSTISMDTYPILPVMALKAVMPTYYIVYNSVVFHIGDVMFNCCVVPYLIVFVALVITWKYLWAIPLMVIIEVILVFITKMWREESDVAKRSC